MVFLFALFFSIMSIAKEESVTPPAIEGLPFCVANQICGDGKSTYTDEQFATAFAGCTFDKSYDAFHIKLTDYKTSQSDRVLKYGIDYRNSSGHKQHLDAFFGCGLRINVQTGCAPGNICEGLRAIEIPKAKSAVLELFALALNPKKAGKECPPGTGGEWDGKELQCIPCKDLFGGQNRYLAFDRSNPGECVDNDFCEVGQEFVKMRNRCMEICHHKAPSRKEDGSCKDDHDSKCQMFEREKTEYLKWIARVPKIRLFVGTCGQEDLFRYFERYKQEMARMFDDIDRICLTKVAPYGIGVEKFESWFQGANASDRRDAKEGRRPVPCNWRDGPISPNFQEMLKGPDFELIEDRWFFGLDN